MEYIHRSQVGEVFPMSVDGCQNHRLPGLQSRGFLSGGELPSLRTPDKAERIERVPDFYWCGGFLYWAVLVASNHYRNTDMDMGSSGQVIKKPAYSRRAKTKKIVLMILDYENRREVQEGSIDLQKLKTLVSPVVSPATTEHDIKY